ncbi:MAG: amidophosphoribosyltransferase [Bdellovibrionales bacterium]|nr:amidophosphoribosyltransferase [Bdellovibrionales bacterium]
MCGVIGTILIGNDNSSYLQAAFDVYKGLLSLQHRGQDASGICSFNIKNNKFHIEKGVGPVNSVFSNNTLSKLEGSVSIGHTRYATTGGNGQENAQPLITGNASGVSMAHNGNIINYHRLKNDIKSKYGIQLLTDSDLELILQLWTYYLTKDKNFQTNEFSFELGINATRQIFEKLEGAYSVIGILSDKGMFAFRDPNGIRPLVLGRKISKQGSTKYTIASESCALNFLGYELIRDINPGEFIYIDSFGKIKSKIVKKEKKQSCMFEWVYFAAAESKIENISVYTARLNLGKQLGVKLKNSLKQIDYKLDLVMPVPDTSRTAAISVSEYLKLPYREGLIKNRYIQRSFILNSQKKREQAVELKLAPIHSEINNKNILLIDDSIVRGTTSKKIISLLKKNGAKNIILGITCPPIKHPCFYGVDFPDEGQLLANNKSQEEVANIIGVEHIVFLDQKDIQNSLNQSNLCLACINKCYPTKTDEGKNFTLNRQKELLKNENTRTIWQ